MCNYVVSIKAIILDIIKQRKQILEDQSPAKNYNSNDSATSPGSSTTAKTSPLQPSQQQQLLPQP